mgnify:CR=1 FL=1
MKNPGAKALFIGAVLSVPSISLIFIATDNNFRRHMASVAFAGVVMVGIGIVQYLSYALRSKAGKAAYREKWRARGLYYALLTTAISSGMLSNSDREYIKNVYNKSTGLTLKNKDIIEMAKRMSNFPDNFYKDMKAYGHRIKTAARKKIIQQCIVFALEKEMLDEAQEALQRITANLYIEPEFLELETQQMLKRERLGIAFPV